jgi:hypothetical protein
MPNLPTPGLKPKILTVWKRTVVTVFATQSLGITALNEVKTTSNPHPYLSSNSQPKLFYVNYLFNSKKIIL